MLHGARQPANVFLMENKAMLGDFGIARVLEDSLAVAMTQVRRLGLGNPTHGIAMAPIGRRSSTKGRGSCALLHVWQWLCASACMRARAGVCGCARATRRSAAEGRVSV